METHNDIWNELSSMESPLAGMSRNMPYQLPEGYFDQVPGEIITAVHNTDEITALQGGTRKMPFDVPAGYFDDLRATLLQRMQHEDAESSLPRENVYAVPEGYFETLPGNIMAAIHTAGAAQVKRTRVITWKSMRWAAAAMVIMCLGLGSVKMIWPSTAVGGKEKLAKIPEASIQAYVQQNIDEFDAEMIENNIASNINLHTQPVLLNKVEKNDIIQYLDENGWEEAANTN